MFGTSLATTPIMASNYIGTRVFSFGLYNDVYVKDAAQFNQIHGVIGIGLVSDTNIADVAIIQLHLLNVTQLVYTPIITTNAIKQNHISIPVGLYLNTLVSASSISQNHIASVAEVVFKPIVLDANMTQGHVFNQPNVAFGYSVKTTDILQAHLMNASGLSMDSGLTTASFGQNHIVLSISLKVDCDIPAPALSQLHLLTPNYLDLDPVTIGNPFVNPSIRRIEYATSKSDNFIILSLTDQNYALVSDAMNSVVLIESNNEALVVDSSTNKYS